MGGGRRGRVVEALSPPEVVSDSYGGMQTVGLRLQVLVGVVTLAIVWLAPGLEQRQRAQVTAVLVGFLAYTAFAAWLSAKGETLRVATLATDLLAVFSFGFVIPEVRLASFVAALLVITFHTHASGRVLGFVMAAGAAVLTTVIEVTKVAAEDRINGFTLLVSSLLLIVLVLMVDALSAERRRVSARLARLNRSLISFVPGSDLSTTLASAADAAKDAVEARFVVVVLLDDNHLSVGALSGTYEPLSESGTDATLRALADGANSPSGFALSSGRPVLVQDITTDERFKGWAETVPAVGFRSMISIPLGSAAGWIGTLNAYSPAAGGFTNEDVAVLTSYGGQVSAVLARALASEQERRAAARLQETERLQTEFITTVSHELRTPLTAVSGFIDTVLLRWEDLGDVEKRELLERASWNAGELRRLVEQVLEFSTMSAGGRELVLVPQRLAAAIERMIGNMAPVLRDHDVRVDVPEDLSVRVDEEALSRILGNLLTNAAKYSPPGTTITVTAEAGAARVTVAVSDQGPGIPESQQERIFERFYRAESSGRVRGTGIGLTIVRTYVERLGGKVWATSEPGRGSTFCFTLPLAEGPALRPR